MKNNLTLALITLALGASSIFGSSILTYSNTTASSAAPFTNTFTLANFDTTLGTLTGVSLTLAYNTTGEVDVFNSTGSPLGFTNATSSIPLTLNGPSSLTTSGNAVAGPFAGTANSGVNQFPGLTGSGTLTITILPANFALFEIPPAGSTDTYSVIAGNGNYNGTGPSGLFFGGSATAGGTTTVTYTYTPNSTTPEPTAIALLGPALLGLGLVVRKRNRKA